MNSVVDAFREWMERRKRVRDERDFHLNQLTGDFGEMGLSNRDARREARKRFVSRDQRQLALREIGGD